MKIKTITCHRVYNYGASLQAYALQYYLEKGNNEVEIIDFWPYFFHNRYNFFYVSKDSPYYNVLNRLPILKLLYGLKHNRGIFKTYGRKRAFDDFERDYLKITQKRYFTSEELQKDPPCADIYVAGSDQIWNTSAPNGHQAAYYLDFGLPTVKRVTYAASFGVSEIPEKCKGQLKKWIKAIDLISVRESTGIKILEDLGITNAEQVLDPVFLLAKQDWEDIIIKKARRYAFQNEKYILLYDFIGDPRIKEFALNVSQQTGIKIVSINDFNCFGYVAHNINDAGPCEFVSIIADAQYVITNSFHATAFSVILEKEFYTFNMPTHNNSSRMKDFCNLLMLSRRYNATNMDDELIDYRATGNLLNALILESKDTLNRFI